jgi:PKD repeat protein
MASGFPPTPVYPKGYDSDSTLFLVYNTSETITTADNPAWSEEITIKPVGPDQTEIWAENGFANIEGELFYYDRVEKNEHGKIYKFKRCIRNLGGTTTKFNGSGAEVRGFVIAEHHNQLVESILKTEAFIGENFSTNKTTLDWRIRNLQNVPVIFDDFTCPDVSFDFVVLENNPATGVLAQYSITIDGQFTAFRLDFGDGDFTTTSTNGTHRYATNSIIDPVITVSNAKCTLVQSPIERTTPTEPPIVEPFTTFEASIPLIPNIPPVVVPEFDPPSNAFNIPPIVFPCLDIGSSGLGPLEIPSVIVIDPPLDIPSEITITPITIPDTITLTPVTITPISLPSEITITPITIPDIVITPITISPISVSVPTLITISPVDIPTQITITPLTVPSEITISPVTIPSEITISPVTIPSTITISPVTIPSEIVITPVTIPDINIVPITIPDINIIGTIPSVITISPAIPTLITISPAIPAIINFGPAPALTVSWGSAPSVSVNWGTPPTVVCTVNVVCPSPTPMMSNRSQDFQDGFEPIIDATIETEEIGIPSEINIIAPEIPDIRVLHDIPAAIQVVAPKIPDIRVTGFEGIPKEIRVIADKFPEIAIDVTQIPKSIPLDASEIPTTIRLDASE